MNVSLKLILETDHQNTSVGESFSNEDRIGHIHWRNSPPLSKFTHNMFGVVGILIFALSMAGNMAIIFLFSRFRSLRSFSNLFVLNLTIADFLLSIGNIPMFVTASFCGYWVFGNVGCKIYAFVGSISSFASINTLAAIAVERCLVIVKTLPVQNRMSGRTFFITVSVIWIYSGFWSITPFIYFGNYILEGTNTSCTFDFLSRSARTRSYVVSIFMVHFVIPISIIVCSYYMIYKAINHHTKEFDKAKKVYGEAEMPLCVRKNNNGVRYEAKTARVSIIVILVFCISWTPYATIALIGEFGNQSLVTRLASGIPCLVAKFSTVVNPLLYALLHPRFRVKLVNLGICSENVDEQHSSFRRNFAQYRSQRGSRKRSSS